MGEAPIFLMFLMLLGGGQGNDLLDLVSSDLYWKSKDIEIKPAAVMVELNSIKSDDTSKASAVRRLMAIRTLGELKSPDAISTLKPLLDSKEAFVADYAQRAIDSIENKAPNKTSGVPPDRMKADLYLLPEHIGAAAQVRLFPRPTADAKKVEAKEAAADANGDQQPSTLDMMAMGLIGIAEQTGNVRIDGVTIAVADSIGPNAGFVTIIVRGKWDGEAVRSAIGSQLNQTVTQGEVDFMVPQGNFGGVAVTVPSDELFVLIGGPSRNTLPLEDLGTAVKTGKGKFEENADLIKTIESIDTSQFSWAALTVSASYAQAPMLAPFDTLTLVGKIVGDDVKYEAKGNGKDADAVKSAVEQFNGLISEGKGELTHAAEQNPAVQPVVDFWNSIELKSDGTTASGTGTIKRGTMIPARAEMHATP